MKLNRILSVTLTCLLTCGLLAGCGSSGGKESLNIVSVDAKALLEPTFGEVNAATSTVADGANAFAFQLSAALLAEQTGEDNFVCSPYSVWIPLAALVNATDAGHKEALLGALNASGIHETELNKAASRMLYDLTNQRHRTLDLQGYPPIPDPLKIANAIFVSNEVTLKQSFAQMFMDSYRGTAMNVDFSSREAVDAVNQWASDNTDGLISDIVHDFDQNTVAAIANAIYFSDRWEWEFTPEQTVEDIFYAPTGEFRAFYMLRQGDEQTYYEDDKVQAMPLNFKTGGGMTIILPKDGDATGLLSSLTVDYFQKIKQGSIRATGKLLLPRFSIESDVMELEDALTALGIPLFDENAAPLTGGLIEEDLPVWLSGAAHKAVIEVDERGTTAAAVTVLAPMAGAVMPQPTEPFEMNCNTPFVFVLHGYTYDGGNQILFTGVVNQPQ